MGLVRSAGFVLTQSPTGRGFGRAGERGFAGSARRVDATIVGAPW